MIDESAHRQVCDALHRAIEGRDRAIAQRDQLLAALKSVARYYDDPVNGLDHIFDAEAEVKSAIRAAEGEGEGE